MPAPQPHKHTFAAQTAALLAAGEPLALIADTHMPRGKRRLPDACVEAIRSSAALLHAGDVSTAEVLDDLAAIGPPLVAVAGNVDEAGLRDRLPEALTLGIGGRELAVVHDSGARKGRLDRMRRWFPSADAVVFGHSHIPLHERAGDGFQIFNPGSPTERRRSPTHTMGRLRLAGAGLEFELIDLG